MVECRTRDRKVTGSIPGWNDGRIFFSRVNVLCWLFCLFTTIVLPKHHVKDPGHLARSANDRLQPNRYKRLIPRTRSGLTTLSRHSVGTHYGNDLTRSSSGNGRPQSSKLAEPLWIDLWSERVELVRASCADLHFNKNKKYRRRIICRNFPHNSPEEKASSHIQVTDLQTRNNHRNNLLFCCGQVICLIIIIIIIIIIYPLTARVVGAPQMISKLVSSIFPCSPLPSGTCRTPGLSIP